MSDSTERLRRVLPQAERQPPALPPTGWWAGYRAALDKGALSNAAKRVVELDAHYIAERCIPTPQEASAWPQTRLRRGLIIGSVQSGKTASMLGVAALSLDRGADVLVILAGTQLALWRQTYDRVLAQLDGSREAAARGARRDARVLLPDPEVILAGDSLPGLGMLYHSHPNRLLRALRERKPIIAVVVKRADHLIRFGEFLRDVLRRATVTLQRPLHCIVLDDEADDGSILDQEIEGSGAERTEMLKQLPRFIAQLWSGSQPPHTTFDPRLFATYVAYTATPQANLLQPDHNPLAPSDFIVALRVPLDSGPVEPPRATTFHELAGVEAFYCGGELFYRRFARAPESFCLGVGAGAPVAPDTSPRNEGADGLRASAEPPFAEPLRAYFVACAIRLLATGQSMRAARAGEPYASLPALRAQLPDPHTMLIHPSASLDRQFETAEQVAAWSAATASSAEGHVPRDGAGRPCLDPTGLACRLALEETTWAAWVSRYHAMRDQLAVLPGARYPVVGLDQWPRVRELLLAEVFPHVRLVIVNSDPRAEDRPEFDPTTDASGGFRCPRDTFAIFVAGNVMSRGLTVEGLATTVFMRGHDDPVADTQMQMQRWFGYRGKLLPWCRVFLPPDQLALFRAYHENDEALRADVIRAMNDTEPGAPTPLVLQGEDFVATRKVSALRNLALHPGATPFVRVVETADEARRRANLRVLTDLFKTRPDDWQQVVAGKTPRGWILRDPLSLVETAELLEKLQYTRHNPAVEQPEYARWRSLERQAGIEAPVAPLLRGPSSDRPCAQRVGPRHCPYSIAAYLRFWATALTRHVRGLFPTDRKDLPWSMSNLRDLATQQPRFYVGVRSGSEEASADPILAERSVRLIRRDIVNDYVRASWGTRGTYVGEGGGYLGDQLFDYHFHAHPPPLRVEGEPLWRPRGAPGLVLFHVLRGASDDAPRELVTVGLAIPHGGPDHFAALRGDAATSARGEDADGDV